MTVSPHILIVDDDDDLRRMISEYLREFQLTVSGVPDARGMRSRMESEVIDLIVLDLKLKHEDGMNLIRELRARSRIPIIILSSRADDVDRIMGLEFGADDYVTKPFNLRELLARIRSVLRRTQAEAATSAPDAPRAYRFSDWELDLRTRRLTSARGAIDLTHTEYDLLITFLSTPQRILSREQLLELIHRDDDGLFDRSVDVQILRLRRKIEVDPSRPRLIKTQRGLGYSFNAKVEVVM
jgi:two-component system, OmpR family, response regulator